MPKTKKVVSNDTDEKEKDETKEILLDDEDKVIDPEIIIGDSISDDEDGDDDMPDDEEVDPFGDRFEE
jgi:hypothetical protein